MTIAPVTFRERAALDVGTPKAEASRRGADRFLTHRAKAVAEYPAMEAMRDRARAIRLHTLANLDRYLDQFADAVERAEGTVFFAADAEEANDYVRRLAADRGADRVVKSKSMVTEEIELNPALEADGREVIETDMGEFIAQLARERPSHLIAPVLHKTRFEIGRLFSEKLVVPYTDEPAELNQIAREYLRERFLTADMGVSGVNMAAAASGTIAIVTNEGNGRLITTAPRIHVAVMGMERIVPTLGDLMVVLEVLARSATGQRLSVYTNLITGPRRPEDPDGPDELHVVVLDNGRSKVLASSASEILACIRCGACLNVCPVYRETGGHAYGSVYQGPVGAVLSPALLGHHEWGDLPYASTLCGACQEVCPVRIDIPRMLAELRAEITEEGSSLFGWVGPGLSVYTKLATNPVLWRGFLAAGGMIGSVAARDGWIRRLPFHASAWTKARDLPAPARESFHAWWRRNRGSG